MRPESAKFPQTTLHREKTQPFVPHYMTFYTSGEKVEFSSQNRFEGKSNYNTYVPTDKTIE
jgi:hypothetical protein